MSCLSCQLKAEHQLLSDFQDSQNSHSLTHLEIVENFPHNSHPLIQKAAAPRSQYRLRSQEVVHPTLTEVSCENLTEV